MTAFNFQPQASHNQTTLSEVFLLGFHNVSSYRFIIFTAFLVIYILILFGNILIILVIISYNFLHSPMYFFLSNLAFAEVLFTTNIIPKTLEILLNNGVMVSFFSCITQLYFFASLTVTESLLLTVMSYDRFLAICRPLHYSSIMHSWFCFYLSATCWVSSFFVVFALLNFVIKLDFCGRISTIDHFFCDLGPILGLSCSDTSTVKLVTYLLSPTCSIFPFLFIILTYVYIVRSILKIQSVTGKKKAFSTCSSHLSVVSTYYITIFMVYLVPSSGHALQVNKILSLLYTVITPLLNPFIYSLNNREIKTSICLSFKSQTRLPMFGQM